MFCVLEKPSLTFLDTATGQFSHNPHRPGMALRESVADAYELLSGRAYSATAAASSPRPHNNGMGVTGGTSTSPRRQQHSHRAGSSSPARMGPAMEPDALRSRIRADLQSMAVEELCEAGGSKAAFDALVQKYLAMTPMGQRYVTAMSRSRELAQENRDLYEVRAARLLLYCTCT